MDNSGVEPPLKASAFSSPPLADNLVNHLVFQAKPCRELMMPPADRIREHNEQDPGRVAHTRQEAGSSDFLAVGPALRILQLNVEGLSAAKRSCIIRNIAERHNRHNVDVICLQETHVNVDCASVFISTREINK